MAIQVLFVCLGNICRSPAAHGVFQKLVLDAGLGDKIKVDSAGTADWHQGRHPDARTISAAKKRGYDLSTLRARQVIGKDFLTFDYILAMDKTNLSNIESIKPHDFSGHLGLFLSFGQQKKLTEVPDPYHGDDHDFEVVLDLVEDAAVELLAVIRKKYNF